MKKTYFIIGTVLGLCLIILTIGIGNTVLLRIIFPDTPNPQITHGEFPFKLVYEKDGEINIAEDGLICE